MKVQVVSRASAHPAILPTIFLAGFALRLYKLGAQSLWYDETVSAFLASQSIPELVAHTARDIHPPAYYLGLHLWTRVVGNTEFALAFLSLIFGVLLIPITYRLARYLVNPATATWTALIIAFSPYNIWYSQEVRMYTLGAVLGVITAYFGLYALARSDTGQPNESKTWLYWLGYLVSGTIGLYTLYYFAFLLISLNLFFLGYTLWPKVRQSALFALLVVNGFLIITYLPWLPIAWRQATNPPVPPWRNFSGFDFGPILLESWSALSIGQSVEPTIAWPLLLFTLALFLTGLIYIHRLRPLPDAASPIMSTGVFLVLYTFGPLLLLYIFSFITPLYHVRYVFTYSPAFYILVGAGLAWLIDRFGVWSGIIATGLLLIGSLYSIYQFHYNPRYRSDDLRAAVDFIQQRWQPGDAILVNAGYAYTAFDYYAGLSDLKRQRLVPYQPPSDIGQPLLLQTGTVNGSPQLGWGDPRSDFYAMTEVETITALEQLSRDFARLWVLRAYDTVTDPDSFIRTWLAEQTVPIEDEVFAGETSIRAQGFLLTESPPPTNETVQFEDGLALAAWELPDRIWQPGQTIHVKLWWLATAPPSIDYKMSLKLWSPTRELAAQGQDEWPVGRLYRATTWPTGQTIYQPTQITLPPDLPAGKYWLNVELYHPETGLPLPRLDGSDPVVTLGSIDSE